MMILNKYFYLTQTVHLSNYDLNYLALFFNYFFTFPTQVVGIVLIMIINKTFHRLPVCAGSSASNPEHFAGCVSQRGFMWRGLVR